MAKNSDSRSLARSISGTGDFLRSQIWVWPIIAAVILAVAGFWIRSVVEISVKETMAENLQTILAADVAALELWYESQVANVGAVASDRDVRSFVERLTTKAAEEDVDTALLAQSPHQKAIQVELESWIEAHGYAGFAVVNQDGRVVSADKQNMIGRDDLPIPEGLIEKVFAGQVVVTPPFKSAVRLEDVDGEMKSDLPTMFTVAPVRNETSDVIALLGLRIRPEEQFSHILSIARPGRSGETYAFNRDGVLVSNSRFDDDLKQIRLLREDEKSILNIQIRDPQVNLLKGGQTKELASQQPLTRMAEDALQGKSGHDVDGYRDYRGVPVIGAWKWLESHEIGVTSEVDVAEAYLPLYILRRSFWGLYTILAVAAVAIFVYSVIVARLQREARKAALEAKELGQYTLDEKIGAGGMGVVYRGHHAMLRRPTAVKLLDPEKTTDATAARFEREVQITARLTHPNTIAIYDYGRTPEGIFYYAMEYLDGIDLEKLVERHGPVNDSRVVHLLQQICASLNEAHGVGLIHRDIKPANMIVNVRGGVYDFVKLLDFGLVKALDAKKQAALTATGSFTGTPLYVSPEGIKTPDKTDARSDLYAVGAVCYFLLTGKVLYDATSVVEIFMHQVNTVPQRPSERAGRKVDPALEALIMRCLAKDPSDRPGSAKELGGALSACGIDVWSQVDAEAWWRKQYPQLCPDTPGGATKNDTEEIAATVIVEQPTQTKP
jgi:hypothetical protein